MKAPPNINPNPKPPVASGVPRPARLVAVRTGEYWCWASRQFADHRTMAEVMAAEEAERARKRIYARERYDRERKSLRGTG